MELEKLDLVNVHVFHENEFPAAFNIVNAKRNSLLEKLAFLKERASKGLFNDLLSKHGAVLLRGLDVLDPDSLAEIIKTIGSNSHAVFFEQNGSTAQRTEINSVLSTANEGPATRVLYQHNEFSRFFSYPSILFFVCTKFNAEGGETPLVHGGEYFERLFKEYPEEIKKLAKKGLYFEQTWPLVTDNNTSWSDRFCFGRHLNKESEDIEEQKKKAEVLVKSKVSTEFEWDSENNLVVHQRTDPIRLYEPSLGDELYPVFFNSIATYYADIKYNLSGHRKTKPLKYNDGEIIPEAFLDAVLEASVDLSFKHEWREGDVVIIDNYQVSHGREPWRNGERKVLVSMWDKAEKSEYKVWSP